MEKCCSFFDSTIRDGSHAVKHQLTMENIQAYCRGVDAAGLDVVIVGHGNGLGASTLQTGLSLLSDHEMLTCAKENLKRTKLGAFLIPGYGTIKEDILPAMECGAELFCIASHCTEANVTRQHIEYVRSQGKEPYGVLMMYHMASTEIIVEQARKMQEYGALGVIIMDSAGASVPSIVRKTICSLKDKLEIKIGFHPHNNLGLAVSNALLALDCGADIIDATVRGFGAGAGNCQLEALAAALQKEGIETGLDLYKLLDVSEDIVKDIWPNGCGLSALSIVSGLSGVFSSFSTHVLNASKRFHVDPRDVFIELGKYKVVGGQEDVVVEVAMNLAQRSKQSVESSMLESLL